LILVVCVVWLAMSRRHYKQKAREQDIHPLGLGAEDAAKFGELPDQKAVRELEGPPRPPVELPP
jgi:hypothetical protein